MAADCRDDSFPRVSTDGNRPDPISLRRPVANAEESYVLFPTIRFGAALLHKNDIEAVLQDGPHARRGDLFVNPCGPLMTRR